nr:MAG TPA: hypothetical protein [Caudoviricetes sp.]
MEQTLLAMHLAKLILLQQFLINWHKAPSLLI